MVEKCGDTQVPTMPSVLVDRISMDQQSTLANRTTGRTNSWTWIDPPESLLGTICHRSRRFIIYFKIFFRGVFGGFGGRRGHNGQQWYNKYALNVFNILKYCLNGVLCECIDLAGMWMPRTSQFSVFFLVLLMFTNIKDNCYLV